MTANNILRIIVISLFFAVIIIFLHLGFYNGAKYILMMIFFAIGALYVVHGSLPVKLMGLFIIFVGFILTPIGNDLFFHFMNDYLIPKLSGTAISNGTATSGGAGATNNSGGSFPGGFWLLHSLLK